MTRSLQLGSILRYSPTRYLAQRGWSAVNDYLNTQSNVLDFLLASQAISPGQYSTNVEESVVALLRYAESLSADKLMEPLRNFLVFEKEFTRILPSDPFESIVTLGGEDERILWDFWHRGLKGLSSRVQHMYLRASSPMQGIGPYGWNRH